MINILVIDEERSVRHGLKFELENEGYMVIDVNNYADAISAFNAFKCDLVISDISGEDGKGSQLLHYFKNVPFIALTTFPNNRLGIEAKKVLKDRFFVKPFSIMVFMSKVQEVLNNRFMYKNAS